MNDSAWNTYEGRVPQWILDWGLHIRLENLQELLWEEDYGRHYGLGLYANPMMNWSTRSNPVPE